MKSEIKRLSKTDREYPAALSRYLANDAPDSATAIGNLQHLDRRKLAIFCSSRCPAPLTELIDDFTHRLLDNGLTAIGGFHSPPERRCLSILLRGTDPIILCPARSLDRLRIRREFRQPLQADRLLFLSFFKSHRHRSDVEMAFRRNRFTAALADLILILHAAPASNTERLCRELIGWQKTVYTIDDELNSNLLGLGARGIALDSVNKLI
jgi:predicted Rossmann fold nucleotide-binding protein DprA/Smf involved in DNA uptake